jgi:uncharacterized protein involved in exopolysaccharide biosynthesis
MPLMTSEEQPWDEHGGGFSVRDILTVVFKRRTLILFVLFSVIAVATAVTLKKPKVYRVTSTMLVNEARVEMPIAPTESTQLYVDRVSEEDLNSEIEVLKSRSLIEAVVRRLENPASIALRAEAATDESAPATAAADVDDLSPELRAQVFDLLRHLEVSTVKKSNVLRVSYVSADPLWAKRVVETLTDEYLKQRAERYQSPQAVLFFEQQRNDAEQRLRHHQRALEEFVDEAGITLVEGSDDADVLGAQKQMVMDQLANLESELGTAEADFDSQVQQVERLRVMLKNEPERLASSSQMNKDAQTNEIERALMALQLERDRLVQDFRPDSRYVRDIDAQIRMAEERLKQAEATSAVSGTEPNPVHAELKSDLLRAEVALEGTRARVASLRSQVAEHRLRLEPLNATAFTLESLQRDVRTAEEDYLRYRKKHEEARISAAMDREKFINVTVAQPAQRPLQAESRGLLSKLVLSAFLGLLGGIGLAFAVEFYIDKSFTTGRDMERALGVLHLASIPEGSE